MKYMILGIGAILTFILTLGMVLKEIRNKKMNKHEIILENITTMIVYFFVFIVLVGFIL